MKAYSDDLREKVLKALQSGQLGGVDKLNKIK